MARGRRLGESRSKVLIIRIPVEWWDSLERIERKRHEAPRDLIREAIGDFLDEKKK